MVAINLGMTMQIYQFSTPLIRPSLSLRRLLFSLAFLLAASLSATRASQSVSLAWDPNPESDIAGYRLYYGTSSGQYSSVIDVGDVTTGTISNLSGGGTYFIAVTAYDTAGLESPVSNEVVFNAPADAPPPPPPPAARACGGNQRNSTSFRRNGSIHCHQFRWRRRRRWRKHRSRQREYRGIERPYQLDHIDANCQSFGTD